VDAITKWDIGSAEERAKILENKNRRAEFSGLTDEIMEYCTLECRHLAKLMEKFRETCTDVGIRPREWSGAGELAAALFKEHGIPKRPLARGETTPHKTSVSPRRAERDPQWASPETVDTSDKLLRERGDQWRRRSGDHLRRVQTGGGVTADIEWSTTDAGGEGVGYSTFDAASLAR
jgi:hypothetical protein